MGIGSLSKYRRSFMVGGFIMFAGGALLRWHHKRTLESMRSVPGKAMPTQAMTWQDDCRSYACRVVGVRGEVCDTMCAEAVTQGSPKTLAERMANACRQQCVADTTDTAECRSACLIREARNQAR